MYETMEYLDGMVSMDPEVFNFLSATGGNLSEESDVATTTISTGIRSPKNKCEQFIFIFYVIVAFAISILGFVGNTVSYATLRRDRNSPVASFQLRSLAVADNLFLLLWLINYSLRYLLGFMRGVSYVNTAGLYVRLITFPVLFMAQSGTIWLTVVIAFNRYVAVCLPYRAHMFGNMLVVRRQVVAVTIAAILYNVPRFFEGRVVDYGNGVFNWTRTDLGHSKIYRIIYTDTLYYLLTFILPLVTLACMNTRVIVTYREACKRRRTMSSRHSQDNEQSITLVMIVIVIVFLACQTLARIVQMVWGYNFSDCNQLRYYLIHVSNLLEVLNSSINFLIYSMFYRQFRSVLRSYLCCGRCAGGASSDEVEISVVGGKRHANQYREVIDRPQEQATLVTCSTI